MKVARAGLTMVTFLSWMVNARTSSFIVRFWSGTGTDKRYVPLDLNSMLSPALCLRQERHVVWLRVRRVHQFLLWGMLFVAFWFFFWFLLGVLCIW